MMYKDPWTLRAHNAEHDTLEVAARRAFRLVLSANAAAGMDAVKQVVAARTAFDEVERLHTKIWTRMAHEQGMSLAEFVKTSDFIPGVVAAVVTARRALDEIEAEHAGVVATC